MSKHNIIELNGIKYDAATGRLLDSKTAPSPKPHSAPAKSVGYKRPHGLESITRKAPAHDIHVRPEHAKTLMRTGVKKPPVKTHTPSPATSSTQQPVEIMGHTDSRRMLRAAHIKQSKLVSRFGNDLARRISPITKPLSVRSAPALSSTAATLTFRESQLLPSLKRETDALSLADAHTQPRLRRRKVSHRVAKKLRTTPKVINISAALAAIALLIGFIAYQNTASLTMRVATTRSGVQGSLPDYHPSGFSLGGRISYSPGQIKLNYTSNTDDRNFEIIQKTSAWNSETLLDNFVAIDRRPFQTRQNNGRTVYIFDGTSATWVDGGIWYQINGKSNLSSDQLLRIVDSM